MSEAPISDAEPMGASLAERPAHVPEDRVIDFDFYNPPRLDEGVTLQESWLCLHEDGVRDVMWTGHNGGHWILTRSGVIGDALKDPDRFSSKIMFLPRSVGEEYKFIPVTTDPPDHRKYRKIVNAAIGPRAVRGIEDKVHAVAAELVEKLAPRGECDLLTEYAEPFPFTVLMLLLDLPISDTAYLKHLADNMTRPDGMMSMTEATDKFREYLRPFIEARKKEPGEDAISIMVNSTVDGRPLTLEEAQNMCGLVLFAGLDTVVNFTCFMMQYLACNPKIRRALADEPDRIPKVAEEILRRFPVASVARLLTEDVEIDGVVLKEGDMVAIATLLPGLDDRVHECPMQIDLERRNPLHMTFGYGPHICAGASLARTEVIATLRAWLSRVPDFEIKPGANVRHFGGIVGAVGPLPLIWDPAANREMA